MRKMKKYLILCISVFFLVLGCEENIDKGESQLLQIKKITDFGTEQSRISLKPEYINGNYYVIESESEFTKYVTGENLPSIDFDNYFLIIGVRQFTSGASIVEEKAEENNVEIIYTVTFQTDATTVALGLLYHAFISKPAIKKETVVNLIIQ